MIKALRKKLPLSNQPASAIESVIFLVIVAILAGLLVLQIGSFFARHRDNERKSDMASLQQKIKSYHALYGKYPSSLQAAGDITPSLCQAPGEHGDCAHSDYVYTAFAAGTEPSVSAKQNCDNKKAACANYILYSTAMERVSNPYYLRSY